MIDFNRIESWDIHSIHVPVKTNFSAYSISSLINCEFDHLCDLIHSPEKIRVLGARVMPNNVVMFRIVTRNMII